MVPEWTTQRSKVPQRIIRAAGHSPPVMLSPVCCPVLLYFAVFCLHEQRVRQSANQQDAGGAVRKTACRSVCGLGYGLNVQSPQSSGSACAR